MTPALETDDEVARAVAAAIEACGSLIGRAVASIGERRGPGFDSFAWVASKAAEALGRHGFDRAKALGVQRRAMGVKLVVDLK
jgi:hypothetical protein